jgi:DNA-binding SARP family transcriptional activator
MQMQALPLSERSHTSGLATSELLPLIKQGLYSLQQEDDAEDAALFALAHEHLSPDQAELVDALGTFLEEHAKYRRTRQAFQEAGIRFARAYEERQAQVANLKKILSTLIEDLDKLHRDPDTHPSTNGHYTLSTLPSQNLPDQPPSAMPQPCAQHSPSLPELSVTCFGRFEVKRSGQPIVLCSNRNAQTILRYLVAQTDYSAPAEKLLVMVWPEDQPEVARNKLHIAISALRRSLHTGLACVPGFGYLVCKNRVYSLNPAAIIRTDVEEFLRYYQLGQQNCEDRVAFYERACQLYKGPFLPEDLYADWSFLQREQLNYIYITMCRALAAHYLQAHHYEEAAKWATMILTWDCCDEEAHLQLMQIYATQGCRSKAIQQYYHCERILRQELGVEPLPATVQQFQALLQGTASA